MIGLERRAGPDALRQSWQSMDFYCIQRAIEELESILLLKSLSGNCGGECGLRVNRGSVGKQLALAESRLQIPVTWTAV